MSDVAPKLPIAAVPVSSFEAPAELSGLLGVGVRSFFQTQKRRLHAFPSRLILAAKPDGLALRFDVLHRGNGERAAAFYRGEFKFAGQTELRGNDGIFAKKDTKVEWQRELHGFAWLVDMETGNREMVRANARALISEWIKATSISNIGQRHNVAFDCDVTARRVISWVQCAPFFLKNCPSSFEKMFYGSLAKQIRMLMRKVLTQKNDLARLQTAIALVIATTGLSGLEKLRGLVFKRLNVELGKQIFADGGHASRNPQVLRDILADLIPVRAALEKARLEVPVELNAALERMMPALRFFTYLDGGLAVFNGVDDTGSGLVKRILETDSVHGKPLIHAPHSGYVRLMQGNSNVMIDTGKPALPSVSSGAAAGVLAFEFCDGASRIVTNCGHVQYGKHAWDSASRRTQAHSGLCLDNQSSSKILDSKIWQRLFGGSVVLSAHNVETETSNVKEGAVFFGRHDGYAKTHGIKHERNLFLSANGFDFRGEDSFVPDMQHADAIGSTPFAIRFHLHPSVRATLSQDGASAMLLLANKTGWRFSARGCQLKLEESVYLPENGRVRKTYQLVLRGIAGRPDKVHWAFKRIEKRKVNTEKAKREEPALL